MERLRGQANNHNIAAFIPGGRCTQLPPGFCFKGVETKSEIDFLFI
jgi:hypothetical protein